MLCNLFMKKKTIVDPIKIKNNKKHITKIGRQKIYGTDEEKKKAQLDAKRKWRKKNSEKIKEYNKQYYKNVVD